MNQSKSIHDNAAQKRPLHRLESEPAEWVETIEEIPRIGSAESMGISRRLGVSRRTPAK
jgi:hypothetical protein